MTEPKRDTQLARKRLAALRRRRDFLSERISAYDGPNPSRDLLERSALKWAVKIAEKWVADDPRDKSPNIPDEGVMGDLGLSEDERKVLMQALADFADGVEHNCEDEDFKAFLLDQVSAIEDAMEGAQDE